MEQPAAIGVGPELALEGLYRPGRGPEAGGAVVAPPHPLYGGSMESPVVTELADACLGTGRASLRFNWRGVGASGGEVSGEADVADADYAAALAFLEESVTGPVVAAGYSFGAAAAVRAAAERPRVERLLLVAPPPALLDADRLGRFEGPVLVVVGEGDSLAPPDALAPVVGRLERGTLERVAEADHFFLAGLAELGRIARAWLGKPA
jgi:alpha/beta superfamily hydrolase